MSSGRILPPGAPQQGGPPQSPGVARGAHAAGTWTHGVDVPGSWKCAPCRERREGQRGAGTHPAGRRPWDRQPTHPSTEAREPGEQACSAPQRVCPASCGREAQGGSACVFVLLPPLSVTPQGSTYFRNSHMRWKGRVSPEQAPDRRPPHGLSTGDRQSSWRGACRGGRPGPRRTLPAVMPWTPSSWPGSDPGSPRSSPGVARLLCPHGSSPFVPQPTSLSTA